MRRYASQGKRELKDYVLHVLHAQRVLSRAVATAEDIARILPAWGMSPDVEEIERALEELVDEGRAKVLP